MLDNVRERKDRSRDGAINVALRFLGAERHWSYDEFDAVGLGGRRRRTEDWIEKGGVIDSPDAEANERLVSFLRAQGRWAGVTPDRMASLTFRPDPGAVDAARRVIAEVGVDAVDLGPAGPLAMPVTMTLADVDVAGFSPESDERWPLIYLATEGLGFVRWAACGAEARLGIGSDVRLSLYVTGGVAHVTKRGVYGWIDVPYVDLLNAWQRFSDDVRNFLAQELPELAKHTTCGAWLRDGRTFQAVSRQSHSFRAGPIWRSKSNRH
jgi:hypothetical protein